MFIESGPALVVDSGMVTTFFGEGLVLVLELPDDNLAIELEFESGAPGEARVDSVPTETGMRLRCFGFEDASGRGSAQPVLIAELGTDLVFLHFRVFKFGETDDRTVHYTFFRASKSKVGWVPNRGG